MATEDAQVKIYICDSPKCRTRIVWEADDEGVPDGFHGKVFWVHPGGGTTADWFACKAPHIRDAVEAALAKTYEQPS